ncbi:MAG TPA: ribonucleotide-diphosphate reductase subunit beta [Solirubrobacteraceae bacterium]|nr:ribonucleotide-diphosphate reductase subunit beta [Solirubrobacteraceae bacterium]
MSRTSVPSATRKLSYGGLYARWETGSWRATELDFTQDRVDWHEHLTDEQRRGALWLYALFFHGEDSVTDNLSPYIDAAPLEEQKYFLATQQADEARHAVFFNRFMHEVVGTGDGSVASSLQSTDAQLTWGHRQVFSYLDRMADRLRRDPSPRQLAAAVTLYHLVVEATLAQAGQHMIGQSLEELDVLPGFRAGMRNVERDEQRHIGFGVKLLSDLLEDDPEGTEAAVVDTLREVLPWSVSVAYPPGGDRRYTASFGFELEDLYETAARSIEVKLRAVGLDPQSLRVALPMDIPPRARGERALALVEANILGERTGPARRDAVTMEMLFDSLRRQADPEQVPSGTTIQWEFPDADPWHMVMENGSTRAAAGRAPSAALTLRCRFDDWVDVAGGRVEPYKLVLRGRLRPRGELRTLARLPRLFA